MEKVRLGIIGIGNMGTTHAKSVYSGNIPGMVLAALCDKSEMRKEYARSEYPDVPFFDTSEELIRSGLVDAIIIAVPHYDHPPIAIDAFENGINVKKEARNFNNYNTLFIYQSSKFETACIQRDRGRKNKKISKIALS